MAKKKSFSYTDLTNGTISQDWLEKLVDGEMLDDGTLTRIAHLGRFFSRVGAAMPNPNLKIGDVFTEDELQKFWQETADEGADIGRYPLFH